MQEQEFGALIALDWADQKHAGCMQECGSEVRESFIVEQKAEAIQEWVGKLRERFKGKKIALAVEQKKGALIYSLMKYELFVIFPLNTTATANYRKALRASGAKDDPSDAELQLDFLRLHLHRLQRWQPASVLTRQLSMLTENRRTLVDEATAVSNQITALLKEYYPTALQMVSDLKTRISCKFLSKWPTLQALKRAKPEQLRKFYYQRNSRDKKLIEERILLASAAVPLIDEKAIIKSYELMIRARVAQLEVFLASIADFDKQIESVFEQHPDRAIYDSLPSVGPALGPRLAVAFGEDRSKYDSSTAILNLSGVAPVTKSSGKKKIVYFRFSAPKFMRQTFIEFARLSVQSSLWARAHYQLCRSRGKTHQASVRSVAYKWIRILYRCWKNYETYDEKRYINALRQRNSPLAKLIA